MSSPARVPSTPRRLRPRRRRPLTRVGLAVAATLLLAGCGGDAAVREDDAPGSGSLAVGVTERNANLFWPEADRGAIAPMFAAGRDRLLALRPRYFRLVVDWGRAQPAAGRPPDFRVLDGGCLRDVPPCQPFAGIHEQLRALAEAQRRHGGMEVLVVLHNAPAWARGAPARGCPGRRGEPGAAAPRDLAAYRRFVTALVAEARGRGLDLRWWSAWNEPNHPSFLAPQRDRCSPDAPALAPAAYAQLVRALRRALDEAPGDQRLVIGEVAGYDRPRPTAASAAEFAAALPRDVACAGGVWSQHAYVGRSSRSEEADFAGDADQGGSPAMLADVRRALARHRCARPHRFWITETGVGGEVAGRTRSQAPAELAAGCRDMHRALLEWYRAPGVDVAFQYTFREDNLFPVGLTDTGLTRTYPTYDLWLAWGGDREPDAPPPPLPAACR